MKIEVIKSKYANLYEAIMMIGEPKEVPDNLNYEVFNRILATLTPSDFEDFVIGEFQSQCRVFALIDDEEVENLDKFLDSLVE